MKRKASRAAPYERPTKMTKHSTTTTVSRNLSTLRRTVTSTRPSMAPARWPSNLVPTRRTPKESTANPSMAPVKWPTLVPTTRTPKGGTVEEVEVANEEEVAETSVTGLRKVATLTLVDSESSTSSMRKSLSKVKSTSREPSIVASLSKRGSVVTLEKSGTVTSVTRLKSGSSIGETKSLTSAAPDIIKEVSEAASAFPPEVRKELSKSSSVPPEMRKELSKTPRIAFKQAPMSKKLSSIRVYGTDAPADEAGTGSPPAVPLPPGGLIEIVFSFDTTGSMVKCLNEVRGRIGDMIQRLQADIPSIRIAVVAHGDYDTAFKYVIKWIDFGSSLSEMSDFVQNISDTAGGIDFDECYELAMARVQTELSWTPGSQRSLVMIGDATPHPASFYARRDEKLDWKEEAKKLAAMGVKIYAVQAMNRPVSNSFYRSLATITGGRHLKLDQFSNIFDIIMAVCYNEKGVEFVEAYEEEVRGREGAHGLHKDLEGVFGALKAGKRASVKTLPKLSAGKAKKTAAPTKRAAKGKAAATAKAKKTTAAASKGKGKATAGKAKGKGKATAGKAKGKAVAPKAKAAAKGKGATGKGAAAKGTVKAKAAKGKAKAAKEKAKAKASAKAAAKAARGKGVKSVKWRKTTKTQKKKPTKGKTNIQKTKPKQNNKLVFRETLQDTEFSTGISSKKVTWSPWSIAMAPNKPGGRSAWCFKRRSAGKSGFRNMVLLQDDKKCPALYELMAEITPAPKSSGSVRKYRPKQFVLGYRALTEWPVRKDSKSSKGSEVIWEAALINKASLKAEVDALLEDGRGRLYIRRGDAKDKQVLRQAQRHLEDHYDYAWSPRPSAKAGGKGRKQRYTHRRLKRCGKLISGNDV